MADGKRIILHLGAPKTGTTSLQASFFHQKQALEAEGIIYPIISLNNGRERTARQIAMTDPSTKSASDIPTDAAHPSFFWPYQKRQHANSNQSFNLPQLNADWSEALAAFRAGPASVLVISFEGAFLTHRNFDMAAALARLDGLAVTLTFGLRHPEEIFHGLYATTVTGRPRTTTSVREMNALQAYLEAGFEKQVAKLIAAVGTQDIRPFYAATLWKSRRTMLGAFLEHVGVATPIEHELHLRPTTAVAETLFVRRLNRRGIDKVLRQQILTALSEEVAEARVSRNQSFLPAPLQTQLNQRFAQDVIWLEQQFGLTWPDPVERPVLPTRLANTPEEDRAICDRLLPVLPAETARYLSGLIHK